MHITHLPQATESEQSGTFSAESVDRAPDAGASSEVEAGFLSAAEYLEHGLD